MLRFISTQTLIGLILFGVSSAVASERPTDRVVLRGFHAGMTLNDIVHHLETNDVGWRYVIQSPNIVGNTVVFLFKPYMSFEDLRPLDARMRRGNTERYLGNVQGWTLGFRQRDTTAILELENGVLSSQNYDCDFFDGCGVHLSDLFKALVKSQTWLDTRFEIDPVLSDGRRQRAVTAQGEIIGMSLGRIVIDSHIADFMFEAAKPNFE